MEGLYHTTETGALISLRAVRASAKEQKRAYGDVLAQVIATTDAVRRGATVQVQNGRVVVATAQQGAQGMRGLLGAINPVVAGLGAMAVKAVSVGAAMETLRRGFMGFAEFDNQLRLTQVQTGMVGSEISGLGREMKALSKTVGASAAEMLAAWNAIREAGNFTPEEASKMLPDLTHAAIGAGANAEKFGRAMGDIMRNLKIPADQYKYVMESMAYANREFNLNVEEMGPRLSQATQYMATWGYSGVDAMQRAVTMFGMLKEATGDAAKAGSALVGILGDLGNDRMGKALGFAPGELEKHLRKVEDPVGELFRMMDKAENKDLLMKAIGIQDKAAYQKFMDEFRTFEKQLNGVRNAQGAVANGKFVAEGPLYAVQRLGASLEALTKSLGMFLDAIGVTHAITFFAETIGAAAGAVEGLIQSVKYLFGLIDRPTFIPKSWEEFKYWGTAERDADTKEIIVPWETYKYGGQKAYDQKMKEYRDAKAKEETDKKDADKKRRGEAWKAKREKYAKEGISSSRGGP